MKFCPYCGTERMDDAAVFCMECGKPLPDKPIRTNAKTTDRKRPEHKKIYKRPSKKARRVKNQEENQPEVQKDDGYDGYYDDVLPVDLDRANQPLDQQLIKRVIVLAAGALLVIAACVAIMYML